ncbi:MAG: hypothetical protein FWD06_07885 [Oscillospiraceae bacterium]|nr:hypothetical protein [Oscillospiraceae bacterium]
MKKSLTILLVVFLLTMATLLPASATNVQSWQFEMPELAVIAIEAQWNGQIEFARWTLWPDFSPSNVALTLWFEDGTSEVLTHWRVTGDDWFWRVHVEHCIDNNVTLVYENSNFRDAFLQEHDLEWLDWEMWDEYFSTLPRTIPFDFPANYIEAYVDSFRPLQKLALDEQVTAYGIDVFSFSPQESRIFQLQSAMSQPFAILNAQWEQVPIDGWSLFGARLFSLEAGSTYYLIVWGEEDCENVVAIDRATWLQRITARLPDRVWRRYSPRMQRLLYGWHIS